MKRKNVVFICYSHEDLGHAKQIHQEIEKRGISVWIDYKDIIPGQNWQEEINKAIRECTYFIALLSKKSVSDRGFVNKELNYALEIQKENPDNHIFIIPVRLEECNPSQKELEKLHRVDLSSDNSDKYNEGIKSILKAIKYDFNFENNEEGFYSPTPEKKILEYAGIQDGNKIAVVYHCDNINKYYQVGLRPTGITLRNHLQKLNNNIEVHLFGSQEYNDFKTRAYNYDTIFLIDSPHVNEICKEIIDNYHNHLFGGTLRPQCYKDDKSPVTTIEVGADSEELRSDKHLVENAKIFDLFTDYLVILRLPSLFPFFAKSSTIVKNKLIWIIYGIHTKGTHAGVSVFSKNNFSNFISSLNKQFDSPLPSFFELVFEVPRNELVIEDYNKLKTKYKSSLRLKTRVALQDDMPSNLPFYFINKYNSLFPIKNLPIHSVHFDPCAVCNFACPNCIEKELRNENSILSYEKITEIFYDLKKAKCSNLNFYGGEPTLHPNFPLILKLADIMGFRSLLVTNGSQLHNENLISAILCSNNLHIRVSIDGNSNRTHCSNHGLNHGTPQFENIKKSILYLLEKSKKKEHNQVSISISYLLHNNAFEDDELFKACHFWKKNGVTSFHLRPVTEVQGKNFLSGHISPHISKIALRDLIRKNDGFVIVPDWFKRYIFNDIECKQDRPYDTCYSTYYRFAISPHLIEKKDYNTKTVVEGVNQDVIETNDAWISFCLYNRKNTDFGCVYPENFSDWLETKRIDIAKRINPKEEPCCSAICNRHELNTQIYQYVESKIS
jgi:MoaA/NifB/PqqE/SkfB family radical SAM enzyme